MADLPDYYTQAQISEAEAASFKGGLDANKSPTPVSRDIYIATDTQILYLCINDGEWTGFNAATLTRGILTLYANMLGGGFQIKNIADPTAAQDAATRVYVLARIALEATARGDADTAEAEARAAADALRLLLTGGTMSGPIAMGTNKITGLGAPTLANDAARKAYVDTLHALCLLLTGGTMSGDIAMGNNIVSGLKAPTADGDAARKKYVDDVGVAFLPLAGGTMAGNIAMAGHKVTGLGAPAAQDDALRYNRAEIRNAEIAAAAAIAYTKLNLALGIKNADIAVAAAIAYTKLALTGKIKAADIEAAAGIPLTKLEAAVCSETELANAIGAHTTPSAHHTAITPAQVDAKIAASIPKVKTETRDLTAPAGDVSYTGYGFRPSALICRAHKTSYQGSFGISSPEKTYLLLYSYTYPEQNMFYDNLIMLGVSSSHRQYAKVKSYDVDGFTLTWFKTGSPGDIAQFTIFAFKEG